VGLPAPLIYFVDVDRGKKEGARLAEVIEGFRGESAEASGVQSLLHSEDEGEYEARTHG
jgi:UMF1 family MFS transporter